MKCDAAQNRLLAPAAPDRLPDAVRDHLAGCEACRRFRDQAVVLDARLAALPAPPSDARKAAFLDMLLADGPVITVVPARPARGSRSLREVLAGVAWTPVGSAAAVAVVGLGLWQLWPAPVAPSPEMPGPRAKLVEKVLTHQRELARLETRADRMNRLTELAADLEAEACGVALAAGTDEMRELADMYEKVVGGVVKQTDGKDRWPVTERNAAVTAAAARLAKAADRLAAQPAPDSGAKPSLNKMAGTARAARTRLLNLLNEGG